MVRKTMTALMIAGALTLGGLTAGCHHHNEGQEARDDANSMSMAASLIQSGEAEIRDGESDVARGKAMKDQGKTADGEALIAAGKAKIDGGEAKVKRGKALKDKVD